MFMDGVVSVTQFDDTTLNWCAQIAGQERRWTAKIVEQVPDSHIVWEGFGQAGNRGSVVFRELRPAATRVTTLVEFNPTGTADKIADAIGIVDSRVIGDLQRFRDFIENRPDPTGSWDGEIREGRASTEAHRAVDADVAPLGTPMRDAPTRAVSGMERS